MGFRAASAGMHFEIAVVGVGLAGKQAVELTPGGFSAQLIERRFGVGDDRVITLGLAKLDQLERIGDLALDPPIAADRLVKPGALAQQFLSRGGIIPQARVLGLRVQLGQAAGCGLPVKDASSAAPATCLCRRRPPESRHAWFTPFTGLDVFNIARLSHSPEPHAPASGTGGLY